MIVCMRCLCATGSVREQKKTRVRGERWEERDGATRRNTCERAWAGEWARVGEGGRGRGRGRCDRRVRPKRRWLRPSRMDPQTHRGCCLFAACQVQGHTGAPPVSGSRPPRLCPVGRRARGKTTLRTTCPNTGSNGTAVSQGLLPVARNTGGSVAASSFACRIAAISVSTLGDGAGRAYPARGAELGTPPRQGGKGTEILEKGILPRLGARSWGYLPGWGHGTSPQRGKRGDRWRAPTCQSMSSATFVGHRLN